MRALLHWILETPLSANLVKGFHDGQRFVQRHEGALVFAIAKTAHHFGGFVLIAVTVRREAFDDLWLSAG